MPRSSVVLLRFVEQTIVVCRLFGAAAMRPNSDNTRASGRCVRSREKKVRKRTGQAKPPAPPLGTLDLYWWRRRFRLRLLIFSHLLTDQESEKDGPRLRLHPVGRVVALPSPRTSRGHRATRASSAPFPL